MEQERTPPPNLNDSVEYVVGEILPSIIPSENYLRLVSCSERVFEALQRLRNYVNELSGKPDAFWTDQEFDFEGHARYIQSLPPPQTKRILDEGLEALLTLQEQHQLPPLNTTRPEHLSPLYRDFPRLIRAAREYEAVVRQATPPNPQSF